MVPSSGFDPLSPTYQVGALPNELGRRLLVPLQGIEPCSAAYKAAASPRMLQGRFIFASHRPAAYAMRAFTRR